MTIINENTVVVFSSSELKTALENDNNYTYIYFGADITLESGIKISSTKSSITIDGTYDNITHKFEDKKTLSASDTITASYPSILKVEVKNMTITGNNYYGVIYVPENSAYKNIIVEYNNVTYTGPQMSFHPVGLTRFIDSNITIQDNSLTTGNEVAECNKIEIGGTTTILHSSKSNSAFWFRNNAPSFTILTNANVNFTSTNRELFYGTTSLEFTILSNSTFNLTSHNGMAYGTFGTSTTTIGANSLFNLKQTASNGSNSTWYSNGPITLNNNSSLIIINNFPSITTSNYNINFSNTGSLTLNNPKRVVLYNEKANIINTSRSIPFNFSFSRLNLFNSPITITANISPATLPTYSWYKDTTSNITGTFTNTTTTILSTNYTEAELQVLPALTNFNFPNKKILSIGEVPFTVNAISDTATTMTGITTPNSSILISYNAVNDVITAADDGTFTYTYDNPLPEGTDITFNIKEYNDLIYHTKKVQIVYPGELIISKASKSISINLTPLSLNPILCPKENELVVTIIDSRINSTAWKLYAQINSDLTSKEGNTLTNSLVYKDESGTITPLSTTKTLVYTGTENAGTPLTTDVTFKEDEGILFMSTDKIIRGVEYETNIIWTIEE